MKNTLSILLASLMTATAVAQTPGDTINRMVLVESTYNPIIAGAVKRNFIPEEVKPSMGKEDVVYADESVALPRLEHQTQPVELVALAPSPSMPGYAHLGYGNYNNLAAMAAYKLCWGEHDLALKGHLDGWNGNLKLTDGDKWRSHLYDMAIGADYDVAFARATLNAGLDAAHYRYNYLGAAACNQKSSHLSAHVGVKGMVKEHYFYQANLAYSYFDRYAHLGNIHPHRENRVRSEVAVGMDFYEWGRASVAVQSDLLAYHGLPDYRALHSLELTPRWELQRGALHVVSGLNMSFLTGRHAEHPLQLSPECSVSYVPAERFSLHLQLDGGRGMHSFSSLYELSPYWMAHEQVMPTYTFVNAHLSGNMRLVEGLHLHLGGGYKVLSDALFSTRVDTLGVTYTGVANHNAQVLAADAGVSYDYKDLLSLSAKGEYQHWMLKGDRALLARAPQFAMDVEARVRIITNLYAYTTLQWVSFTDTNVADRERAIVNWSLGAHYALNKRCTLFCDAHNLLNRRHSYYAGYPSQGFNVLMGAMVNF